MPSTSRAASKVALQLGAGAGAHRALGLLTAGQHPDPLMPMTCCSQTFRPSPVDTAAWVVQRKFHGAVQEASEVTGWGGGVQGVADLSSEGWMGFLKAEMGERRRGDAS